MRRLPPLAALRAFEAAARHLSFRRAAAELAVTPTAISHQIRLLEATLGTAVFARRPLRLTAAGQAIYPALRDGFDAIAAAIASATARPARAVVTLSATRAFTARWLVPRVPSFAAANPGLDLRLHAADEPVDLRAGTVDAAIRYGSGAFPGLAAEELFREAFAPVASPRLRLRAPAELRRHALIHFEWHRTDGDTPLWPRWLARAGLAGLQPKAALTFTDESNAIQAAIAGQGVALLGLTLIAQELASGALVQPFGPVLSGPRCFLVYPDGTAGSERIAAVRAWIGAEIRRRPATTPAAPASRARRS